ncbi:hypothetical protein ACQV5M_16720 [Leptospira sp. SA-E8]|uniref:hypothetical protein n=1 Tax=Leptospira sp. SA-E8 TaxID=3422259 RepID=UPI003EC0BB45
MSLVNLSYEANTVPSAVDLECELFISNNVLQAAIRKIQNFRLSVHPTGNFAEEIVSGVAWPLAEFLAETVFPSLVQNLVLGFGFNLITIDPVVYTVENEKISIEPKDLKLSNFNGMLMLDGSIDIK